MRRLWLVALVLVAGACASADDDGPSPITTPGTTAGATTTTTGGGTGGSGVQADCVGSYLGTFSGDDSGPLALSITGDGSLAAAFVRPDALGIDLSDLGAVAGAVEEIGLAVGDDITIGPGGVEISPAALEVDTEGVRLGFLEVGLAGEGAVAEDGTISGSDRIGGSFNWDTCTGSGNWTEGSASGTWRAALAAAAVRVDVDACDEGLFVGVESDFGVAIDFDAYCLSRSVQDLPVVSETDEVEVKADDEVSVYTLNATVLFEFGSAALTPEAESTLDEVAAAVTAEGVPAPHITVIGHTDSIGSDEFNLDLSLRRAEAVRAALGERLPQATIEAFGLGEASPVAPNGNPDGSDNPDGRRRNRRVEVIVTQAG